MSPMFAWGLDEAVECIGLVMAAISGLLFLLFATSLAPRAVAQSAC